MTLPSSGLSAKIGKRFRRRLNHGQQKQVPRTETNTVCAGKCKSGGQMKGQMQNERLVTAAAQRQSCRDSRAPCSGSRSGTGLCTNCSGTPEGPPPPNSGAQTDAGRTLPRKGFFDCPPSPGYYPTLPYPTHPTLHFAPYRCFPPPLAHAICHRTPPVVFAPPTTTRA